MKSTRGKEKDPDSQKLLGSCKILAEITLTSSLSPSPNPKKKRRKHGRGKQRKH
jgi:hypothetical protein